MPYQLAALIAASLWATSSIIATGTTPMADPAVPAVSIIGGSMLDEAGELLRPMIRDALEAF